MKKYLMTLVAMVALGLNANAQSCAISGASDGSTIEVQSCYLSGDNVIVNVINDSQDIAANVTVYVSVSYKWSGTTKIEKYSGRNVSLSRVSTEIKIPIKTQIGNYVVDSVRADSVSGTKCQ